MRLVEDVYKLSRVFPREELYGLTSQLRRAIVSVPANIAEGHGRNTPRDYAKHISIAKGSLLESATLVEIAGRLGYVDVRTSQPIIFEAAQLERMLSVLRQRLLEKES